MTTEEISIWKKFFSPKDEVHNHWYSAVDNFSYLSGEFYQAIERELTARKVPGLEISRPEFNEGGMLTGKREYLRLQRERLVFDICAAPFGTSYFFSFRFVELPLGIKPMEMVIFLIGLVLIFSFFSRLFGSIPGFVAFLVLLGAGFFAMRNAATLGLKNLDANLLKTPVIGAVYEVLFRKETYFREDTRLMYVTTVNAITELVLDEVTTAKGVKIVKRFDRKPIHGAIFEERSAPKKQPEAAA